MTTKVLCYSGASKSGGKHNLGSPHYSYRFAEEKFLRCFDDMAIDMHFLPMPEYYSAPRAYATLPRYNDRHVHVIFRSTELIRLLKNGYNIVCFAWEFPYLKDHCLDGEHPFSNQRRMLSLCDEIWVPCDYTRQVLERHGIANVHWIPAPIDAPTTPECAKNEALKRLGHIDTKTFQINFLGYRWPSRGDEYTPLFAAILDRKGSLDGRNIYLSVFNPEDFRKNLDAMVRGFDTFQQRHGDAILIIKALTSVDRFSLEQVVRDVMVNKLGPGSAFANDSIIVFNQFLTDEEMTALYDLADFYLCTSLAEGQNLPLLEAMARGVVPVTTRNTAMLDYITPANSFTVETTKVLNENEHLAGNVAGKPYEVELCNARQVASALHASAALPEDTYARMSSDARSTVLRTYSSDSVRQRIAARFRVIAPGPEDEVEPPRRPGAKGLSRLLPRRT